MRLNFGPIDESGTPYLIQLELAHPDKAARIGDISKPS